MSNLTQIRKDILHITQVELAAICGVAQSTVSRWERGVEEPSQSHIRLILKWASANGKPLSAGHFFDAPEVSAAKQPVTHAAPQSADSAPAGERSTPLDGILTKLALDGVIDASNAPRQPFTILYRPGSAKGELLPDTVPPPMDGRIQRWEPEGTDGWRLVFDSHGPIPSDEAA